MYQDVQMEVDHKQHENRLEKTAEVNNDQINNEVQAQIQKQSANQIPGQIKPAQANKDQNHQRDDHMDVDPHNIKDQFEKHEEANDKVKDRDQVDYHNHPKNPINNQDLPHEANKEQLLHGDNNKNLN